MLEAYSTNVTVAVDTPIPFNNVTIQKGCTARLSSPSTVQLNKCGVYMISCNASSSASATIQLYKNGVAQPQAQSTGGSLGFTTLVQVTENNSCACCSSPTLIQILNAGEAEATFLDTNIVVTKVC